MNEVTIDNFTFNYVVRRTTKGTTYIRVRNQVVYVSTSKTKKIKDIENILAKHIAFIKEKLTTVDKVVHINGVCYNLQLVHGLKNNLEIIDDKVVITSKMDEYKAYQKVLFDYFKKVIEKRIVEIIYEVSYSFKEFIMPEITVKYLRSAFGKYYKTKHKVIMSSILARYDMEFTKMVLYHELTHVLEFSHSERFHKILESKYPGAKRLNSILRKIKYNDYL